MQLYRSLLVDANCLLLAFVCCRTECTGKNHLRAVVVVELLMDLVSVAAAADFCLMEAMVHCLNAAVACCYTHFCSC